MATTDFTAVADCPKCGNIAVHWLDGPRRDRSGCLHKNCENNSKTLDSLVKLTWGGVIVRQYPAAIVCRDCGYDFHGNFDPVDCVVARVCRECEHRWPMK